MTIRLLATDLDGTLLGSDGAISARTRSALEAAEKAGLQVIFVTGRPLRWARDVFDAVGGHGLAIVSNGAVLFDVDNDRALLTRCIAPQEGLAACAALRDAVPGTRFAIEDLSGISLETGFVERNVLPEGTPRGSLVEIFTAPVVKLLARHEKLGAQEFWDAAEKAIGDRVTITWSSDSPLLEISAAGVTKASTLAMWCAEHGLSADEVAAVGDMPNDLPMLEWAGASYAMANAHPTVLAAADQSCPSNDEDGVAQLIGDLIGC